MGKINRIDTSIPDLFILEPKVFGDYRGYLLESYNRIDFAEIGLELDFVQDNMSRSTRGVLRGLHFQKKHTQGKLVKVTRGRVFDVGVDLRKGSPTYGQWEGAILDDESHRMLFLPEGFAHGFLVLSEIADFSYKCTDYYDPENEGGIIWNDPDIGIEWPLEGITPLLSEKDKKLPRMKDIDLPPFVYNGKEA
jgi:dTDP-4-dehydrorhamnose 3,5-epimerase